MGKKIIAVDTELSCWDDSAFQRAQIMEIFQFGLAVIDVDTLTVERSVSYYVKNERHEVTDFCTNLTGVTQKKLTNQGFSLEDVSQIMKDKWGIGNRWNPIVAWGDESAWMRKDYNAKGIEYPFHNCLINIADYYRFGQNSNKRKRAGLKKACNYYGVEVHQPQHDAESDAITLANVMIAMIKKGDIWPMLVR